MEELDVNFGSLADFTTAFGDDPFDDGHSSSEPSSDRARSFGQRRAADNTSKSVRTLSPRLANLMTPKEMSDFAMLQLFTELAEKRIETWGRVTKLIVMQPMDGLATPGWFL
jgi:hypothetical protein